MVATTILPVHDLDAAEAFWTAAGLRVERYDDGYAFLFAGDVEVAHLGLFADLDPAANRAGCYVRVDDVDAWHARCRDAGLPVGEPRVERWGMREFRLADPSGNYVRVGRPAQPTAGARAG